MSLGKGGNKKLKDLRFVDGIDSLKYFNFEVSRFGLGFLGVIGLVLVE